MTGMVVRCNSIVNRCRALDQIADLVNILSDTITDLLANARTHIGDSCGPLTDH